MAGSADGSGVADRVAAKRERVQRHLRRRKLIRFAQHCQDDYDPQWYHQILAEKLDRVRLGEITRLLVFMPPQHGKSELISRKWPAHILGNSPDTRIIATSYAEDLAAYNAREVRKIIRSNEFIDTFGPLGMHDRTVAKKDVSQKVTHFEVPGHRGYLRSAGLMGSVTGFGFDIGIIDDPIKNEEEANSETYRDRLKTSFHSVFETRGSGMRAGVPDRIVGVFTRWHHDDLGGYILKTAEKTGDKWDVLSFPAILDTDAGPHDPRARGEVLWPSRYPSSILMRRKRGMSVRTWDALYQQRPSPLGGGIFKRKWWMFFDPSEVREWIASGDYQEIFQSWDLSFKKTGTSRVCGLVCMVRGANLYVLDCRVDHMGFVEAKDAITEVSSQWPAAYVKLVEDKANGPAVIDDMRDTLGGLVPWPPEGEKMPAKEERWNASSPPVRSRNVFLPPSETSVWTDEFLAELGNLPNGTYDDIADAFAQAVAYWRSGFVLEDLAQW